MTIALKAKDKLGFINRKCEMPPADSPLFEKQQMADSMVVSWILNSISKELVESFLYTTYARELWDELEQHFGESHGPLFYQIKQDMSGFSQGNSSVTVYFTKLKKLWDKLSCLHQYPVCNCGAAKTIANMENEDKLVQFLMGLNESYEHVKNQILLMDAFPSVIRAYSMVLRVEKQRDI
uniref:Uncharacterized protein LOC114914118 n=1 Tax=Elaeis guineensis var. tenera TaxID=51953 RepID=A0A8N4EYU2_ELAGV|nr:uncharacterized protein LOC114914118 [Elaeis guineensis]